VNPKYKAERLVLEIHANGCAAAVEDKDGRCLQPLGDYRNLCAAYRAVGDSCLPVRVRDTLFGGDGLYEVLATGKGQYKLVREGGDADDLIRTTAGQCDLVRRMLQPCFN
jgi:hypothetical protein